MTVILVLAVRNWSALRTWLDAAGPEGAAAFVGVFVVLTACCFPVSVFGFTAGFIYGPLLGYALLLVAIPVSGGVMYLLGRSGLRDVVRRLVGRDRRLRILEEMAGRRALRLNLLARLSPFNYGIVCYTLAAGRSGWRNYMLGLLGTLPSLALQVAAGVLARNGVSEGAPAGWRLAATVLGVVALLALGWQVSRLARRAWQESAAETPPQDADQDD
jgi:uncharacterized membrane protein YdjX (TVP38/TMEM64 family)